MDFKAPPGLSNAMSQAVPGKFHGSGGLSKSSCLHDWTNFHRSRDVLFLWNLLTQLLSMAHPRIYAMLNEIRSACWCAQWPPRGWRRLDTSMSTDQIQNHSTTMLIDYCVSNINPDCICANWIKISKSMEKALKKTHLMLMATYFHVNRWCCVLTQKCRLRFI